MFVPRSRFVELLMSDDADSIGSPANVHDDAAARCPADRSIMARAAVELEDRNSVHIDRCGSCLGVWFDSGEWAASTGEQSSYRAPR